MENGAYFDAESFSTAWKASKGFGILLLRLGNVERSTSPQAFAFVHLCAIMGLLLHTAFE